MSDCEKHCWARNFHDVWECVNCPAKVKIPYDKLMQFVSNQYFIEQLFEGVPPIQPGEENKIHISPISPTTDDKPWLNTTTGKLMKWDGKEWVEV